MISTNDKHDYRFIQDILNYPELSCYSGAMPFRQDRQVRHIKGHLKKPLVQ
jgi:hypothetical protein